MALCQFGATASDGPPLCGFDLCPDDPEDDPGICGCGNTDQDGIDTDKDGVPDCIDQCPGEDDFANVDHGNFAGGVTCPSAIPAISDWGLAILILLVLVGGTVVFRRRWTSPSPPFSGAT